MTRKVMIGGVAVGGGASVKIQSMNNTDTRDAKATLEQIARLADAGCDITRVAVPDREAAEALKEITADSPIPVVADIHFDYTLAIAAAENGAAKIRINPGNIGGPEKLKLVADCCRERGLPIRVGVNSGSISREILAKYGEVNADAMTESALGAVKLLEDQDFDNIVISNPTLKLDEAEGPFNFEFTAGDPGDNNAGFFFNGAMDVLKPYIESGKVIVKSGQTEFSAVATPSWKSETAQKRAEDILAANYADGTKIDAWVCSNDSTALGVTNALEANYDVAGLGWPIITGQDCDKTNVKNMIAGKQSMSVFKDTRTLAAQVVKMVGQILKGEKVDVNDEKTYNNNKKVVPSFLCEPVFGDANNYKTLLIDSGYYTEDDLK